MNYLRGNFENQDDAKGYISGAFFPKNSVHFDDRVEIKFEKLPDDFSAPKHLHKYMKTWVIVTRGKMYFQINGEPVEIGEGEFLIFEANTPEEVVKVDPGTECINIHAPSIVGGDKEVL